MSETFDRIDAAMLLSAQYRWWGNYSASELPEMLEIADAAQAADDPRGAELHSRLEREALSDGWDSAEEAARLTEPPLLPVSRIGAVSAFGGAAIDGVRAAEERMNDFGLRSHATSNRGDFRVTDDARRALGAEGAAATLRVLEGVRDAERLDQAALVGMVRDLHANPWDGGPMRRLAEDAVYSEVGDHLVEPVRAAVNHVVPEQANGTRLVADIVTLENDREALRARAAAAGREMNAERFSVGAGADSLAGERGRQVVAPTSEAMRSSTEADAGRAPQPHQPGQVSAGRGTSRAVEMRGGERYQGRRDPGQSLAGDRGLER